MLNVGKYPIEVIVEGGPKSMTDCRKCDWQWLKQMKLQNVKSLLEVITRKQVLQIVAAARTQRMAVYFWTVYSLGLRMQEGLNLQIGDSEVGHGRKGSGMGEKGQEPIREIG